MVTYGALCLAQDSPKALPAGDTEECTGIMHVASVQDQRVL